MLLKSPIQMAHNKLYNINCQQAVYWPVYMQPVGCSVMLHCAAIKMWMFLTAQGTGSFLVRYTAGSVSVRYTRGSFLVILQGVP